MLVLNSPFLSCPLSCLVSATRTCFFFLRPNCIKRVHIHYHYDIRCWYNPAGDSQISSLYFKWWKLGLGLGEEDLNHGLIYNSIFISLPPSPPPSPPLIPHGTTNKANILAECWDLVPTFAQLPHSRDVPYYIILTSSNSSSDSSRTMYSTPSLSL